ncbi:MAG: ABC transporter ATP-binding protein/permease [Christensenellaceae bacterium]|jgi:ATP-binding cassette subfamily B protein|nr:ABC transporter ATP-binding protein/permease [Christensenellaceae bacterium]
MSKKPSKLRLILRFMPGALPWFLVTIAFSALVMFCDMVMPQIVSVTVDSVLGGLPFALPASVLALLGGENALRGPQSGLLLMAAAVAATAIVAALARYVSRVAGTRGSERYVQSMRDALFSHIQKLPFAWHTKNRTGDIIQRCTSDVDQVRGFVTGQLVEMVRILFQVGFSMAAMFAMNAALTMVALGFVPVIFGYSCFFSWRIQKKFQAADEEEGTLSTIAQENLTGVRVVRAFGRERFERDKFERQNETYTMAWVNLGGTLSWFWTLSDFIPILLSMVLVALGSVSAVRGEISAGQFIAFLSYAAMMAWPLRQLGRMVSEMSKAGVSIDRLNHILSAPAEQDRPGAVAAPLKGGIAFEHIRFGYSPEKEILHDVSFTIPAGSTFAILGGTGSGKSTLMHLLNRLYELPEGGGRITIDGIDIAGMKAAALRDQIGMVLQEPFLFSRTIGENIALSLQQPDEKALRAAAADASLEETIAEFPLGFSTVVGERGVTLSGGQRQRAAIARALIKDCPVLVFDDSLSAVDTKTDARIRAALARHRGKATLILISHRVTTLMAADQILVLDGGRVAELGSHEELLARGGIYRSVWDLQMQGGEREHE